jgi:multidrug transporter EmrE-like cation transporter
MTIVYLIIAIVFESGWALTMKMSDGFSRWGYAGATVALYLLSVVFLALATRKMELGVAYAIWAGSGVALIAIAGVFLFKEPISVAKGVSIALIIAGIVGLQLSGVGHGTAANAELREPSPSAP